MKQLKILRTIEAYHPYLSGPVNQAREISKRLVRNGIKSSIYTSDYGAQGSFPFSEEEGVEIHRMKAWWSRAKYFFTPQMYDMVKKEDFDIVHVHNYRNFQSEVGYWYAKKKKIPLVINTHGSLLGYSHYLKGMKAWPYRIYDSIKGRKILDYASFIIVSSQIEKEEAIRFGIPIKKIKSIPMGIDVEKYECKRAQKEVTTALFVGRISRNRNLGAFLRFIDATDYGRFRIVGPEERSSGFSRRGYLDQLKTGCSLLKPKYPVAFTGPLLGQDLIKEYQNADYFISSSRSENFGQPLLEAAAAGLPIISTPVGIAPEIISDYKTGFIVPQDDQKKMKLALKKMQDPDLRRKMGKKIQDKARKYFRWDKIIREYLKMYHKVLKCGLKM